MFNKKKAIEFSKCLDDKKIKSTDKQLNELLDTFNKASTMLPDLQDKTKEAILANAKITEVQMENKKQNSMFNLTRVFQFAGAAAIIALMAVLTISILPSGKINSKGFIQKALAVASEPGKVLHLVVTDKMSGEKQSFKTNYWIDVSSKKTIISMEPGGITSESGKKDQFQPRGYFLNNNLYLDNPVDDWFEYSYYKPDDSKIKDLVLSNYKEILERTSAQDLGKGEYKGKDVYRLKVKPSSKDSSGLNDWLDEAVIYFDIDSYLPVYIKGRIADDRFDVRKTFETDIVAETVDSKSVKSVLEVPEPAKNDQIRFNYHDLDLAKEKLSGKGYNFLGENYKLNQNQFFFNGVRQETKDGAPEERMTTGFYYFEDKNTAFGLFGSIYPQSADYFIVNQVDVSQRKRLDFSLMKSKDEDLLSIQATMKQTKIGGFDVSLYHERSDEPIKGYDRVIAQFAKGNSLVSIDGTGFTEEDLPQMIKSLKTY